VRWIVKYAGAEGRATDSYSVSRKFEPHLRRYIKACHSHLMANASDFEIFRESIIQISG